MSYFSNNPNSFLGKSVGNGQCVAFVRAAANLPQTSNWKRGKLVMGATLVPGTAIATFSKDGDYANDTNGKSHAAIYLGQNAIGIQVLDQWITKKHLPNGTIETHIQEVHRRTIAFGPAPKNVNDARKYYVIE